MKYFSKGAVIILLWLILINSFDPATFLDSYSASEVFIYVILGLNIVFYLLLPVAGLLADMKFGRFVMTIFYTSVSLLSSMMWIIQSSSHYLYGIRLVALPLSLYSTKSFIVVALLYGTDQLADASSQYFSCYIWLHYWCLMTGHSLTSLISCTNHHSYILYINIVHLLALAFIVASALLMKKTFIRNGLTENPFKSIYFVLKFAYNHKYPLKRSALTYWEETQPSRIDLGKPKYGGPFTEATVESVKTFLRLLPLLCVVSIISFPFQPISRLSNAKKFSMLQCLLNETYFIQYCVVIVLVPLYLFAFRNCCRHFQIQLSMLRKIGLGISISVLAKFGYAIADLYITVGVQAYDRNRTVCLLEISDNETETNNDSHTNNMYVLLFLGIVNSLGTLLIIATSLEFVFAQSPQNMRGLLVGLWYCFNGLLENAGEEIAKLFQGDQHRRSSIQSCKFYVHVLNFAVMLSCLTLFVIFSKRYKLHRYNDVFDTHGIVEEYYENDFKRRDLYQAEYGSLDDSSYN